MIKNTINNKDEQPTFRITGTAEAMYNLPDEIIIESGDKPQDLGQGYDAGEHSDIGNFAFGQFLEKLYKLPKGREIEECLSTFLNPKKKVKIYNPYISKEQRFEQLLHEIRLSDTLSLTPGDIVALAGDFLGIPDEPIAFTKDLVEQERRFENAYAKLANSSDDISIINNLVNHIREEAEATSPYAHWSLKFIKQKVTNALGLNNIVYALASEKSFQGIWHSRYFSLLLNNFDHFGEEARVTFLAGHRMAIKKAHAAGQAVDSQERANLLRGALLRELFACHFLTDLFASGHVRTPRKQLLNYLTLLENQKADNVKDINTIPELKKVSCRSLLLAGFFSKKMHDEDSQNGIYVETEDPDNEWEAYGDGNYHNLRNQENAKKTCETVLVALEDLVHAYNNVPLEELKLIRRFSTYVPKDNIEKNRETERFPMFIVENNQVLYRSDEDVDDQKAKYTPITDTASLACRFFTIKIKPPIQHGIDTTLEKTQAVIQDLQELHSKALDELITQCDPMCTFM